MEIIQALSTEIMRPVNHTLPANPGKERPCNIYQQQQHILNLVKE
jgi:hypothetical protein